MSHKKNAFTLIELLVVIAIIALLLSILMPSLNKVKDRAKDVICRTNLKSLQLATILYTDDYGGKMMQYDWPGPNARLWINQISSYMDNVDQARYCPATRIILGITWGSAEESWGWPMPSGEFEYGSYAINGFFYAYPAAVYADPVDGNKYYSTIPSVKSPSLAPIFADSLWVDAWPRDTDVCPGEGYSDAWGSGPLNLDGDVNYGGGMSRYLINRHGSHINVGFIDGHQKVMDLEMLWTLKWNASIEHQGLMRRTDGTPIYP
jgi:prepilin-type N-terminal cleavage/methylation domain-containing protein/prepilin-type processing-associated H-X9-DG protein